MDKLLLSVGTNSSATLIRDDRIVCGYETDRLTQKEATAFPYAAMYKLKGKYDEVYISHNHIDPGLDHEFSRLIPGTYELHTLSYNITQHDVLAHAARTFAGRGMENAYVLVANNFGSINETVSVYDSDKLLLRAFGLDKSLGFIIQYGKVFQGSNSFHWGMLRSAHDDAVIEAAGTTARYIIKGIETRRLDRAFDLMVENSAAVRMQYSVGTKLRKVTKYAKSQHELRILCSKYIITVCTHVLQSIITSFKIKKLILTGSVFLEPFLTDFTGPTKLCIMPLAGDQGGPFGLYSKHNSKFKFPDKFDWNKYSIDTSMLVDEPGVIIARTAEEFINMVCDELTNNVDANIVKGVESFGMSNTQNMMSLSTSEGITELTAEVNPRYHKSQRYLPIQFKLNPGDAIIASILDNVGAVWYRSFNSYHAMNTAQILHCHRAKSSPTFVYVGDYSVNG